MTAIWPKSADAKRRLILKHLPMSTNDIARYVGASRETVRSFLKAMKADEQVYIGNHRAIGNQVHAVWYAGQGIDKVYVRERRKKVKDRCLKRAKITGAYAIQVSNDLAKRKLKKMLQSKVPADPFFALFQIKP